MNDVTAEGITEQLKAQGIEADVESKEETGQKEESQTSEEGGEVLTPNPVEEIALENGWNPKGDKDAAEFVAFALKRHSPRGKEIKELKKTVDELATLNRKQRQAGYEEALAQLQEERHAAILDGDPEEVDELDGQINEQQTELNALTQTPEPLHPAVQAFSDRHKDWIADKTSLQAYEMQMFVAQRDQALAAQNLDPEKHMEVLESNLHEKFPEQFGKSSSKKVAMYPSVDRGTVHAPAAGSKAKDPVFKDMSSDQKKVARHLQRSGAMKVEEYMQQLKDLGEL